MKDESCERLAHRNITVKSFRQYFVRLQIEGQIRYTELDFIQTNTLGSVQINHV